MWNGGSIYQEVNARKRCCTVRKGVAPCKRCARVEVSVDHRPSAWTKREPGGTGDAGIGGPDWGLKKLHPLLLDWTDEEVNVLPCRVIDMSL